MAWLVGFVFVTLFSWNYFNLEIDFEKQGNTGKGSKPVFTDPVLPRFATSPARYWKWLLIFWFITFILWLLVAYFIDQQAGSSQDSGIIEWYKYYPPVFAAFLIIGMPNVIPKELNIINILQKIRDFAHSRAKIPDKAFTIFSNIMKRDLMISESDMEKAIEHVGHDYLMEQDFANSEDPSEYNSIEKNWIKICHFKTKIDFLTENAGSKYTANLNNPELVHTQAEDNFNIIKQDIKEYKHSLPTFSKASLQERTRLLLKQFSKIIVCLVFASEPSEKLIFNKLQQLGINCKEKPRYEINISFLLVGLTIFAFVTFIVAYVLGMNFGDKSIDATKSIQIGFGAVLVICAPIICVFGVKIGFNEIWPVRGQYSDRRHTPWIVMFFMGIGLGILSIFLTAYTGLFGEKSWTLYIPYALLSCFSMTFAAVVIDSKPRIFRKTAALVRILFDGFIGLIGFFIFGLIATICVKNLRAPDLTIEFIDTQKYTLILLTIIGFVSGVIISFFSEIGNQIENESEELSLNLSEYLLPALDHTDASLFNISDLNKSFQGKKETLSPEFCEYLTKKGCMTEEDDLTEKCIDFLTDLRKTNACKKQIA